MNENNFIHFIFNILFISCNKQILSVENALHSVNVEMYDIFSFFSLEFNLHFKFSLFTNNIHIININMRLNGFYIESDVKS